MASSGTLLPEAQIVSKSLSEATLKKKNQAQKLLLKEAEQAQMQDPVSVSQSSSKLVLNLLYHYSGIEKFEKYADPKYLKGKDAVLGIIAGLRWVYRDAGHTDHWQVSIFEDGRARAHGNPLEGNPKVKEFRQMHAKKLSEVGRIVRTAPPLCPEHIIEHGKRFLTRPDSKADIRDISLHAYLLVSMNCGMRYDELAKVKMENVTATKYSVEFGVGQRCKNSTFFRSYILRRWPGDHFSKSILMDPLCALTAWLVVRGNWEGYLFCNIAGKAHPRLILHEPWPRKSFVEVMQTRFSEIGIGSGIVRSHTGHSPKRGGVQLLRALGCKDSFIMQWFGMTGQEAYIRYTEGFNDASGLPVPDFSSSAAMLAHARTQKSLDDILCAEESKEVEDWLRDFEIVGFSDV